MLTFQRPEVVADQPGRLHNRIGSLLRRRLLLEKFFVLFTRAFKRKLLRVQYANIVFIRGFVFQIESVIADCDVCHDLTYIIY